MAYEAINAKKKQKNMIITYYIKQKPSMWFLDLCISIFDIKFDL